MWQAKIFLTAWGLEMTKVQLMPPKFQSQEDVTKLKKSKIWKNWQSSKKDNVYILFLFRFLRFNRKIFFLPKLGMEHNFVCSNFPSLIVQFLFSSYFLKSILNVFFNCKKKELVIGPARHIVSQLQLVQKWQAGSVKTKFVWNGLCFHASNFQ